MQKFRFQKEQRTVYTETQDFEVLAEDYEKAKLIAMEMIGKPLEDSENIVAGKWELSYNSFQPYPLEMNDGQPTVSILDDGGTLICDNTPSDIFDIPEGQALDDWWKDLPDGTKGIFSSAVTECYEDPEKLILGSGKDIYGIFWERLESEHRRMIYRYWRIKSSHRPLTFDEDREITIELAGELADYCLVLEHGMEPEEMADPDGGYLEPYDDSFNRYYDRIEAGLMDYK